MKNTKRILAFVLAFALVLGICAPVTVSAATKKQIVGTYNCTEMKVDGQKIDKATMKMAGISASITFKSNGTCIIKMNMQGETDSATGKWKANKAGLKIDGVQCKWSKGIFSFDYQGVGMKFKKK